MPNPRIRSLFHTLVVVGASVSACGGKSASSGDDGEAARAGSGGASGAGAGSGGTVGSAGAGSGGAAGGAGAPLGGGAGSGSGSAGAGPGPLSCDATTQWKCVNYTTGEGCHCDPAAPKLPADCATEFAFTCDGEVYMMGGNALVGCSCVENPLTPDDCEHPEQFGCNHYFSYFAGCSCRPDAPLAEVDCEERWCTEFRCRSEVPRYGCSCEHLGCIK